jgi:hypothetical protein
MALTTDEVYWQLNTSRNLVTTKTEDTNFLQIQPVHNNNILLMQSSSGLINLMTFNMASTPPRNLYYRYESQFIRTMALEFFNRQVEIFQAMIHVFKQ